MAKRRNDEKSAVEPDQKRRKQGLIHNDEANPVGSDGLSQCFRLVKTRMHVSLAPVFSADPIDGIKKQHLDPLLLTYESNVRGVIVSYTNVRLLKRRGTPQALGKIMNESPFSYFWVACDLLVWSPQAGDVVEGWVSVQSPGHIALLIHDTFNASIKRTDIPGNWEFVPQEDDETGSRSLGYWKDAEGRHVDGKLQFNVKKFLHGGRTVLALGSLLTPEDVIPPQYDNSKSYNRHEHDNEHGLEHTTNEHSHGNGNKEEPVKATGKKTTFDD